MTFPWRLAVPLLLAATPWLTASPASAAERDLTVTTVVSGLQNPWDIAFLPASGSLTSGAMLFTERESRRLSLRLTDGTRRTIWTARPGMRAAGETGLMAVEAGRDFSTSREFYTCHGFETGSKVDVRVVKWRLNTSFTSADFVANLVIGLPSTSGRHGGCALVKGGGTSLYVGTGDAAVGRNPQSLTSGGGKVLRIDATDGSAWPGNPFASSSSSLAKKTYTYGHRNVQGLARRADGRIFSQEHGSYRDDEVNVLAGRRNFGWNPVARAAGNPSYNEGANSPMTDHSLPGTQTSASWRSGNPTIAPSGIDFLTGEQWGSLEGLMAMSVLKGQQLRMLRFDASGAYRGTYVPPELDRKFGRLRASVMGPDGALYVTTSNGSNDKILRVVRTGD